MSSDSPKIDSRTYETIIKQIQDRVTNYTQWQNNSQTRDPGIALIRIFGRMVQLVSNRLNQVPDKNFLAFLDLVGGELNPPEAARVPLTFSLVDNSVEGLVPAYTQVSAPPQAGANTQELVFETEQELVVTTAQLKAICVRDPANDKYSARSACTQSFSVFEGDTLIDHSLYIACDDIFNFPNLSQVTFTINTNNTNNTTNNVQFNQLPLNWFYWNGTQWQELVITKGLESTTNSPQYTLSCKSTDINKYLSPTPLEIQGQKGQMRKWIKATLQSPAPNLNYPQIQSIKATVNSQQQNLIPQICLYNSVPLDLSKNYNPFGQQPQVNDTFYIALNDDYIKPGVSVTIKITLNAQIDNVNVNPTTIVWEIGNGNVWQKIPDQTISFIGAKDFNATLTFPNTPDSMPSKSSVNNIVHYWIRARIDSGNFTTKTPQNQFIVYNPVATLTQQVSKGTTTITVDNLSGLQQGNTIQIVPIASAGVTTFSEYHQISAITPSYGTTPNTITLSPPISNAQLGVGSQILVQFTTIVPNYNYPVIQSLQLSYNLTFTKDANYCAFNDFLWSNPDSSNNLTPFSLTADKKPTFYLGFDQNLNNKTITLFVDVKPPSADELANSSTINATPPQLIWEYSTSTGWNTLSITDGTQSFANSGLLQFIAPSDIAIPDSSKISTFNRTNLYWLRVRWTDGTFPIKPFLNSILMNTVWAYQATSLQNEILGSSNAQTNQVFTATHSPILAGEKLEIEEGQIPVGVESKYVNVILNDLGEIQSVWVTWQAVDNFYASKSNDRHYVIDRLTGKISFGDGQSGMIPPRGTNNVRLSFYLTGGGKQGNVGSLSIKQLNTTIPYIDSVLNAIPAAGGADQEDLDRLKQRVPKELRHRNRAVTAEDIEDLAYESSGNIAKAKVITPDFTISDFDPLSPKLWLPTRQSPLDQNKMRPVQAGQVKLIVVPYSKDKQPIPTTTLLTIAKKYIRERCDPTLTLVMAVPQWKAVDINSTIVTTSLETVRLKQTIQDKLEAFLHCLTGGKDNNGWNFGESPNLSDVYAMIHSIPKVDYVKNLIVTLNTTNTSSTGPDDWLIYSGNLTVTIASN